MKMNMKALRHTKMLAVSIVSFVMFAEVGLRANGVIDFPLYEANSLIGYVPRSNQRGSFMNRNDWKFNEVGMGAGPFNPGPDKIDSLLIGDSIVFGGNAYMQHQKLGPQMEALTSNIRVWPISAGSWSLENELTWLEHHTDVVSEVDQIDFVLNGGDFDGPSSWKCQSTHPTRKPLSAMIYLFQKSVWDWSACSKGYSPYKIQSRNWQPRLKAFLNSKEVKGKPVVFHLYPNFEEYEDQDLYRKWADKSEMGLRAAGANNVARLFRNYALPEGYYKDGIHPSASGIPFLALKILGNRLP